MPESRATLAEYFRLGLETGQITPAQVRHWADDLIRELPEAPGEIIEVAWSKGLPQLIVALNEIPGERDSTLAGRWLLGLLRAEPPAANDEALRLAVGQAMQIVRTAGLGTALYYQFDSIDDGIFLAIQGQYGTMSECRTEFEALLAKFPDPPFSNLA